MKKNNLCVSLRKENNLKLNKRYYFSNISFLLIILIFVFVLFNTSCENTTVKVNTSVGSVELVDFSDQTGLNIEYITSITPKSIRNDNPFKMAVLLRNPSEILDVTDAYLYAVYDDSFFELLSTSNNSPGKSVDVLSKKELKESWDIKAKKVGNILESLDTKLQVNLCYEYNPKIIKEVCIDPKLVGLSPANAECSFGFLNFSSMVNTPVSVKEVEQEFNYDETGENAYVSFRIYLNKPKQDIYGIRKENVNFHNACENKPVDWGYLNISVFLGNQKLKCNREYFNILYYDELVCVMTEPYDLSMGAYKTNLEIHMQYHIRQSAIHPIKIEKKDTFLS